MFKICLQCTIISSSGLIVCSQRDMHLIAVVHTFELYKKNIWKIKFSKYSQVWYCFEDLDVRNTMLQSEFNLDFYSGIIGFFLLQTCLHVGDIIVCACSSLFACKQSYLLSWKVAHHMCRSSFRWWWDVLLLWVTYNRAQLGAHGKNKRI